MHTLVLCVLSVVVSSCACRHADMHVALPHGCVLPQGMGSRPAQQLPSSSCRQ
jgi:invasion protein IalB